MLQTELADGLQQAEARLAARALVGGDEVVIDQVGDHVEIVGRGSRRLAAGYPPGGKEGEAPFEDREATEEPLLRRREELIAPGNRVAHRAVPGRGVARAARQDG